MGTTSNRFDFVRLTLASLVFLYHAIALSSGPSGGPFEAELAIIAELAIQGFFIVSGLLVYGSLERSRSLSDYAGKRFRRLYPAYLVIVAIPALLSLGLTFGEPGALGGVLRYFGANALFLNFLEPTLPGLFEGQRFTAVNGALWTLKIEVMFYLALPLIARALTRLSSLWWLGLSALVVAAFAWKHTMLVLDSDYSVQLARQLPGQLMFFAAGMALWRLRDRLVSNAVIALGLGVVALSVSLLVPELAALRVIGLTGLIVGVAFAPGPELNAARWGDVSYGVYIVHFPIIQGLIMAGVFQSLGQAGGVILSAGLTLAASFLLWWWVEKPALRRDSHYRKATKQRARDERIRNDHPGRDTSWNSDPDLKSPGAPQRL